MFADNTSAVHYVLSAKFDDKIGSGSARRIGRWEFENAATLANSNIHWQKVTLAFDVHETRRPWITLNGRIDSQENTVYLNKLSYVHLLTK